MMIHALIPAPIPGLDTAVRSFGNHLWQSTLTACAAVALIAFLRKGEARLRHAIWMVASLKFLVPFTLLVEAGRWLGTRHVLGAPVFPVTAAVSALGKPFAPLDATAPAAHTQAALFPWILVLLIAWAAGCVVVLLSWLVRWGRVQRIVRGAVRRHAGREAEALDAARIDAGIRQPIPLFVSGNCMEPGISGILRPALLWPAGISAHLDDAQLAAIVAHEVCHVRRRDNLLALLHMGVEALFWFHPLVWWMGARLMEERERACDEAVLRMGNQPEHYADAILKACRFCIESPLACVSGVSGADLKQRIVRIMNAATIPLSRSRKMLLATVALAAVACPITMGILHPRVVRADEAQNFANLRFTSASLTPTQSTASPFFVIQDQGEFRDNSITMKELIAMAYGVRPERIVGGPGWIDSQRFNFEAHWTPAPETASKIPPPPGAPRTESLAAIVADSGGGPALRPETAHIPAPAALQAMLRNFLAEHVSLKLRDDSAVLPVYELVVANGGFKLAPVTQEQPATGEIGARMEIRKNARDNDGNQTFTQSFAISNGDPRVLCEGLSNHLGHEVIDKTGLSGRYNFEISLPAHADPDQLAAFLRDRYGLDLQSTQQPVKVFAVDSVAMPQSD